MPTPWNALAIKSGGTSGTTPLSARRALGISEGATTDNMVSIKDFPFRAVGDGVTDDTAAVVAFLLAISGKAGYMPAGTYKVTSTLSLTKGTILYGDGVNSVINYTGAGKAVQMVGTGAADNWASVIRNLRINTSGTHGLYIKDANQIEIDGLTINGASTAAIELAGTVTTGLCLYIDIHDCYLQNNTGDGIFVNNTGAAEINVVRIFNNVIQGNNGCAINHKGGSGRAWQIIGNDLEGNGGAAGIYLNGGIGVDISCNYWEEVVNRPSILIADTGATSGVNIHGNHFTADLAITNAITLGVSAFVTGISIKGNSFLGSYTNAISPAGVIGGDFGPNSCAGAIIHVSTPGGSSTGIVVHDITGTRNLGYLATTAPRTGTSATDTIVSTDTSFIANRAGTITLTLESASSVPGKILMVRTIQAQTVVSASSNVVPLVGGAAGTAILAATAGKWALLQSDASNWQIMAGN